jgi:hypothetical protein
VRAVARAHGGDATARSEPSGGSEFEITLPEAPPATGLDTTGLDTMGLDTTDTGAGNAGDVETIAEGGSPGSARSESRRAAHRP